MNKKYIVLGTATILLIGFAIAAYLYDAQRAQELSAQAQRNAAYLESDYSYTVGDNSAKVTIVEFFDPACETCAAFHPFVKEIMAANPGKIRLVMRYTPFHQGSDYVVKMLEAARMQGKFMETLETAYASQPAWAAHHNPQPQLLWRYLGKIGLDLNQAQSDMDDPEITRRLQQDLADARQLQVTKTPSFFVNGEPLIRFGYEELQNLIVDELNKVY